jgi:hypothetical protein
MYNNQKKRKITLGQRKITLWQKKFVIIVDHDRINNDPMILNLRRGSMQRIQVQGIKSSGGLATEDQCINECTNNY